MANNGGDVANRGLSLTIIKLFHLLAAIQFCAAVYYDFYYVHVPSTALRSNKSKFGGKFKFLTFIDGVKIVENILDFDNCISIIKPFWPQRI